MDQIEIIVEILTCNIPHVKGIYLYGSRARGLEQSDSDYDVAVLSEWPYQLKPVEVFELGIDLAEGVGHSVDLIDLRAVPLDLRFEVVALGRRIYCEDVYYCNEYEMTAISMYQRFELERKELVKAYKQRILSND